MKVLREIERDLEVAFRALDRICIRSAEPRYLALRHDLIAAYDDIRWRQGKDKQRGFER